MTAGPALRASLAEQLERLRGAPPPAALTDALLEEVPAGAAPLLRLRPRSFDDVREAEALAGLGRPTPYWASAWPSGYALTRAVAAAGEALRGLRVVELGCGLGLAAAAAARAGASVLACDAVPEAVVYAAHNLAVNDVRGEVAVATFADAADLGPFDLLIAADVLYTRENAGDLARLLPRLVAAGGAAWIADPGRANTVVFCELTRSTWRREAAPDPVDPDVTVHRLRRRA